MQSTASTWFCITCGAANDVGQAVCFSCKRARAEHIQPADNSDLLQSRYRVLAQVGVGGFGEVYKALDTRHAGRVVAIKQINLRGLSPQKTIEATDTFNRELHILSPLKHPNLPRIYDHFTDPDHWYLVMEFLEGETLERYLENLLRQRSYAGEGTPGLLLLTEIFALAFQLCDVLDYLHARQPPIIFRDIKPANIMRTGAGRICLIDFGIARLFTPGRAKDTTPLGSPGYAAPEQYGKAQTTARSDLYSLGALLHYLVTGNDPSETPFQFAPLPQLSLTTRAGTQELESLILRMVDVDSSQRPATAREVKEELQRIASLVAESAAPRIWSPPPGLPPDPEAEGALQQQVQIQLQAQIQKRKSTTRRKFLTRSLVGGGVLFLGGALLGPVVNSLLSDNGGGYGHGGPGDQDQGSKNFRGQQSVSNIALSPDGKQAAFISTTNSVQNGEGLSNNTVRIYQLEQGGVSTFSADPPGSGRTGILINALAWSPDTKNIAFGYTDGSVTIWDINSKTPLYTYNNGSIGDQVEGIAWSPDGKLIASGGLREVVRIHKASDGEIVSTYNGNSVSESRLLSWSPDSKRVVIEYDAPGGSSSPSALQVWDVTTGQTHFTFASPNMLQVAWSPGGNVIASVDANRTVYLWNASNGKLITPYVKPDGSIINSRQPVELLWSPDSKYLVLDNGDSDVQIWNTQNGATRSAPAYLSPFRVMIWPPGGILTIINASRTMRTIDVSGL